MHSRPRTSRTVALNGQLNTNYVPTPKERHLLEREISPSIEKLAQIQSEVNDLQSRFEDLNRQRNVLNTKTIAYWGMLSPARRLMPDILQEIFTHCLPGTTNPVMSRSEPPLVLGRVCSQWRSIAYTTPALWSAIHIAVPLDSPFSGTCSNTVRTKAIVQWLSRAGAIPLSISLSAQYGSNNWGPEIQARDSTVELFLDTIGPFLVRCRSIHISVLNPVFGSVLKKHFRGKFPFLYHLDLDAGPDNWAVGAVRDALTQLSPTSVPELRKLSLISYGSKAIQLSLPWRQLTALKFSDATDSWRNWNSLQIPDALLLLSWCSNLRIFSALLFNTAISYSAGGIPALSTMITLPYLTDLDIQCKTDPEPFFACLNTPSLRSIHYRHGKPLQGEDQGLNVALRPFIQRVIQPIEELQLIATYLTETDIIRCLELFPGLKRLSLTCFGGPFDSLPIGTPTWNDSVCTSVSRTILDRFMRRENLFPEQNAPSDCSDGRSSGNEDAFERSTANAPCLCPRLERLRINGASFPDRMLLSLIHFRVLSYAKYGVSPIRWLEIAFPSGREGTPHIMEEVQGLQTRSRAYIKVEYGGRYYIPGHQKYSPYHGLASVDSEGAPTYTYNPSFSPTHISEEIY